MIQLWRATHLPLSIFLVALKEDIVRVASLESFFMGMGLRLSKPEWTVFHRKDDPLCTESQQESNAAGNAFSSLKPWRHGPMGTREVSDSAISRQEPQARPPDRTQETGFCSNQEETQVPHLGELLLLCSLNCDEWMNFLLWRLMFSWYLLIKVSDILN